MSVAMSGNALPFLSALGIDTKYVRSFKLIGEAGSALVVEVEMLVPHEAMEVLQKMSQKWVIHEREPSEIVAQPISEGIPFPAGNVCHHTRIAEVHTETRIEQGGIGGGGLEIPPEVKVSYECVNCGKVRCDKCRSFECEGGRSCEFFAKARESADKALRRLNETLEF